MIDPRDISVVAQGPIVGNPGDPYEQRHTLRCLRSIRRHLPGAEIVLSTWKGSNVANLPFDRLIESDDPGGWPMLSDRTVPSSYNTNRQITSTRAGLLVATRPYAMKLRSDLILTGDGFLRFFGKYQARNQEWNILRDRVITPNIYARNPHNLYRAYPFHPSDWFFFGWREDVLNIWDIPHTPEPETSRWFDAHPRPAIDCHPVSVHRYQPEQYVWVTFLRKYGEVLFEQRSDFRHDAVKVSELTLANNLVIAELEQLQIKQLKSALPTEEWASLYTHGDWLRMYKKYCDGSIKLWPDTILWRRKVYRTILQPISTFIVSPRSSSKWGHQISTTWEAKSPATFRAAKKAYTSLFSVLNRGSVHRKHW